MQGWWLIGLAGSFFSNLPTNVEWHYTGQLQRVETRGTDAPSAKKFSVTAVATKATGDNALVYLTDDRDEGAWAWPERYGALPLPAQAGNHIRIRHKFDGNLYVIALRSLMFEFPQRLTGDAEWTEGRDRYTRVGGKKVAGRDCTMFEVALDLARRQTLAIESSTGLLVQLQERLFLGRGDAFELTLSLEDAKPLETAESERTQSTAETLLTLQTHLNRTGETRPPELTREQVEATTVALPALKKSAPGTMWARLVETIERDLAQQSRRLEGVAGLAQKFIGQPASLSDLRLITGASFKADELKGHTTVLHFWDYNGDKLVEPYGQVGYLDFLQNRRAKLGAKIVGVAVDSRISKPGEAPAATRSFRKLQEFMNLSFPIATDDGTLLAKFGDPRSLGSALPLWVVIGHDGVITHYHVGHYDIQPDEGLKQLDAAVVAALKRELESKREK